MRKEPKARSTHTGDRRLGFSRRLCWWQLPDQVAFKTLNHVASAQIRCPLTGHFAMAGELVWMGNELQGRPHKCSSVHRLHAGTADPCFHRKHGNVFGERHHWHGTGKGLDRHKAEGVGKARKKGDIRTREVGREVQPGAWPHLDGLWASGPQALAKWLWPTSTRRISSHCKRIASSVWMRASRFFSAASRSTERRTKVESLAPQLARMRNCGGAVKSVRCLRLAPQHAGCETPVDPARQSGGWNKGAVG